MDDTPGTSNLLECPYFVVKRHLLDGSQAIELPTLDAFLIVMCIAGNATAITPDGHKTPLVQGETILVPAEAAPLQLCGQAQLINASVR